MAIYIITHKYLQKIPTKQKGYKILYVGADEKKDIREEYLFDNIEKTISYKNKAYCELTGLYWIWKNVMEEYVGLVHYRRFFTKNCLSENSKWFFSEEELKLKLLYSDVLVGKKIYVHDDNIYKQYSRVHYEKDLLQLEKIINTMEEKYHIAFETVFSRNYFFPANMFYCKKEVIDEYCEWLFSILFVLEKQIDINEYNAAQMRVFGFLGERLLNVWIEAKQLKVEELPVIMLGSSWKHRINNILSEIIGKKLGIQHSNYNK